MTDALYAAGRSALLPRRRLSLIVQSPLVVYAIAAVAATRPLAAWYADRGYLTPDTGLYVYGAPGLYPSPLGTFAGWALGWDGFALLNVVATGLLVLAVARLARELGGVPALAAGLALVTPLSLWTLFAGVDALAALLLVVATSYLVAGQLRSSSWLAALAAATHATALPIATAGALASLRKRPKLAIGLGAGLSLLGASAALLTPYRGILSASPGWAIASGAATVGIALLPFLPFARRIVRSSLLPQLAGVAIATGLCAGVQAGDALRTNCRYALPLTMLLAAVAAVPTRRARP